MPYITAPPIIPDPRTLSQAQFEAAVANFLAYFPQLAADINAFIIFLSSSSQIHLGGKSSPPTTDNSGNSLAVGQTYMDNASKALYVWDGLAWVTFSIANTSLTELKAAIGIEQSIGTGGANFFYGSTAAAITTGVYNSGFGKDSLKNITTGSYNCAVGNNALSIATSAVFNCAFGYGALINNVSGNSNVAIGFESLKIANIGIGNVALGTQALSNVTSGGNNIGIGAQVQVPSATGYNQLRIGDTNITYAGVQVAWTVTSDIHWKTDIKPVPLGIEFINKLNPVSYIRKNDKNGKTEYGLIAQELKKVLDESGADDSGMLLKDDDGLLHLRYNDLLAPMIKSIQELSKEVSFLRQKVVEI